MKNETEKNEGVIDRRKSCRKEKMSQEDYSIKEKRNGQEHTCFRKTLKPYV